MCCGVPEDMYDLVVVVVAEGDTSGAFATAFEARARQEHVAVVVPGTDAFRAHTRRLRETLERSEIAIIEGEATPDVEGDPHYLTVDGRLLRAERVVGLAAA